MGKILLICRLAVRDLRRRRTEAVLLLVVITAATATLTMGLVLHGVTIVQSYERTRAATSGPDVVVNNMPASGLVPGVKALAQAPGVIGHGGPYPVAPAVLRAGGYTVGVTAEGRDVAPAPVDQPEVTQGNWVRPGGLVVERSFADALGVRVGDPVTLNGRRFRVAGVAITAASPPYPATGYMPHNPALGNDPGLIWLTRSDARRLATSSRPLSYTLNLKLADPARASAFVNADDRFSSGATSWQEIRDQDTKMMANQRLVLLIGSWLLGLLALASVAVLVGGRIADQTRRVGVLKAAGGTPGLIAAVLLAEYLFLALLAAAAGLMAGWQAAPLLARPSFFAGLAGTPGAPRLTISTAGLVVAVALAVAVLATLVPAARAARTSTVRALADSARPPRRRAFLIAVSARLPVPLLLGLRLAARRPRRIVLTLASITVTVATIVAVLVYQAGNAQQPPGGSAALDAPQADPVGQVMLVITVALVILAAINALFVTWATVLDASRPAALSRAFGATPQQVSAGLSAAQVLPALPGAILGIPAGIGLYVAVSNGGVVTIPPGWQLLAVVAGAVAVVAGLTAIPARIGARRPVAEILQSEAA
jgi:ABC-type lipoprotein release transport system permease subunit